MKQLIKPIAIIGILIFAVAYWLTTPLTLDGYLSCASYAVSGVTAIAVLYDLWLWRWNPLEHVPVLRRRYCGKISSTYENSPVSKEIMMSVKQTLFSVQITAQTDINSSITVVGLITKEYGAHVLYYTYMTNPNAIVQKTNPAQYGTCRMELEPDTGTIKGKYWTSSGTTGDIVWSNE